MKNKTIKRENLYQIMENMKDKPLGILLGPMGYGKSTSVKGFLKTQNSYVVWINVIKTEEFGEYLWRKIAIELKRQNLKIGEELEKIITLPPIERLFEFIQLINSHKEEKKIVLVIEYYGEIEDINVTEYIQVIAREQLEKIQILLIAQKIKNLNLAELVIKDMAYIIDQELLAFNRTEVEKYLLSHKINLSQSEVQEVYEYTQGWPAALWQVKEDYHKYGNLVTYPLESGLQKIIFDKLEEEECLFFTLVNSLDEFSVEEASRLIEANNLFYSIEELCTKREMIEYHSDTNTYGIKKFFKKFLQEKIWEYSVEEQKLICIQIANLYINRKDYKQAIVYLRRADAYNEIIQIIIQKHMLDYIYQEWAFFKGILEELPKEYIQKEPMVYIQYAYIYVLKQDNHNVEKCLEQIKTKDLHIQKAKKEIEECKTPLILAIQKNIKSFYNIGEILLTTYKQRGEYRNHLDRVLEEIRNIKELNAIQVKIWEYTLGAEYYFYTGNVEASKEMLQRVIYQCEINKCWDLEFYINRLLIRIYSSYKQYNLSQSILNNMIKKYSEDSYQYKILNCIDGYINQESLPGEPCVCSYLKGNYFGQEDIGHLELFQTYYLCEGLLRQKEYQKLENVCEVLKHKIKFYKIKIGEMYIGVYESISKYHLYGAEKAQEHLLKSLLVGEQDELVIQFCRPEPEYLELLYRIKEEKKISALYIQKIISLIENGPKEASDSLGKDIEIVISKQRKWQQYRFTDREVQIINKLVQSKTNKQIATELFVADITVGKSLSNIYRKLGVSKRGDAIRKLKL